MMLAACSNEDVTPSRAVESVSNAPMAVGFDTYTSDNASTRAGQVGVMTTTTLQTTGFGVFATQTDNTTYSNATATPNFMYNQQVTYASPGWTYNPLKFWPNETIDDNKGASSITANEVDKVSFFAYAPWVNMKNTGALNVVGTLESGVQVGITAISANNATGDPKVYYTVASKPTNSVDLLWGVAPTGGLTYTDVHNASVVTAQGKPFLNLTKPSKDQKIKFLFKHALARIGLKVVAAVDQIAPGGTLNAAETKIVIKEINITAATAKNKGILNLNNTTANTSLWSDDSGTQLILSLTKDATSEMVDALKYVDDGAGSFAKTGVTTSEQNVIADNNYFMVIPTHADETFTVEIKYVVITKDDAVNGGYVVTENKIKKNITITNFTNNKAYTFKLILGMTSVKLDAEVADWEVEGDINVDLPKNNE